jgi:hypothetical protein
LDLIALGVLLLLLTGLSLISYLFPLLAVIGATRLLAFQAMRVATLHRARPALREAASRLALTAEVGKAFPLPALSGRLHGVGISIRPAPARLEWKCGRRSPGGLEIALSLAVPLPHRLVIATRDDFAAADAVEPVKTRDHPFDREFLVHGRASDVAARLDAGLRRRLVELSRRAMIYAEGESITFVTRRPIVAGVVLAKLVERMALVGRDLSEEGPAVPDRLLANAMSEESTEVRFHNLDLLLREFPTSDQAEDASRIAWDARERAIRFLAAIRRGQEGLAFLIETAELTSEAPPLRVMILGHLAHHAPGEATIALLRRTLCDASLSVARTSIEMLGRLGDQGAISALKSLAARWSVDDETRICAIKALGSIGDVRRAPDRDRVAFGVERFLLELLGRLRFDFATPAIKAAAATALGRIGSLASLKTLHRLRKQHAGSALVVEAAAAAIAKIETRSGPVERGQLSLSAPRESEGGLSLASSALGAVSTAPASASGGTSSSA